MTHFVTQKLARTAATIGVRADYALQAQRATSENIYTLERIIERALPLAEEQLATFPDYFGEPAPAHLHAAVSTEIELWRDLQESLQVYAASEPNESDAARYAANVRQFLSAQLDLLQMTEELVHSCLVDHYLAMTRALRRAAKEVPL
jgi:hypothetical protein